MKQSIVSLAQVIRSKNAGPYELVLDILFKTKENYERVKSSGQLTPELIARLYHFHLYGKNGVMGDHEPMQTAGHELGIVLDVVAPTQEIANSVCSLVRSTMLH
uniref:DUF4387 family protein n=1 Tax=Escherichia coli TaxID=562 RepID=UPI00234E240B